MWRLIPSTNKTSIIQIIEGLQDSIKVLNTVDTAKSAEDIVQQLQAIKQVLQYIEHVNIADGSVFV